MAPPTPQHRHHRHHTAAAAPPQRRQHYPPPAPPQAPAVQHGTPRWRQQRQRWHDSASRLAGG
eukprot:5267023-Alexandrium_andersonii.AAC.1